MDISHKLAILKETCADEAELDHVVEKLFDLTLGQHKQRLERYARDVHAFEIQYGMDLATFYQRFEAGERGDAMDVFEWAGLDELRQDLLAKIRRVESAL